VINIKHKSVQYNMIKLKNSITITIHKILNIKMMTNITSKCSWSHQLSVPGCQSYSALSQNSVHIDFNSCIAPKICKICSESCKRGGNRVWGILNMVLEY